MSIARIAIRSVAFKSARAAVPTMAARSFAGAAVMQKDVIQDLFIKELKAYKPQPVSASDESSAKELKLPAAPAVPQVDADLTQQLAAYDAEPEEVAN
ncbi:ATP synthase complex subunit H-domain-containing protein [Mucor mucedo]|uniref:ATP synthase complex subunit H-domain-containing protein n=1 Tax=Mucor mucedo TaxID=29922 RepID=UPI002220B6F4|nr:ATP synthase complex subunit H-domain-containing protein [Mucor mucedo]KAI7893653.1 ATP synthase complex subunit H-domain-containing protein [Mucor mucedo]